MPSLVLLIASNLPIYNLPDRASVHAPQVCGVPWRCCDLPQKCLLLSILLPSTCKGLHLYNEAQLAYLLLLRGLNRALQCVSARTDPQRRQWNLKILFLHPSLVLSAVHHGGSGVRGALRAGLPIEGQRRPAKRRMRLEYQRKLDHQLLEL